jgi:hypothetical protein
MEIVFRPDGTGVLVHSDEAAPVAHAVGAVTPRRASHVEPTAALTWTADMAPSGGPVLGPFATRTEALQAEHAWLASWLAGTGRRG